MITVRISGRKMEPKRGRHLLLRLVAFCASALLLLAAAGIFLFVAPVGDPRRQADVLLVLAPPGDRLGYAEALMEQGYAETLAISVPFGKNDPASALCDEQRAYSIVCFNPDPVTTQGEARALRGLANEHGWTTANVVTDRSHIQRATVILKRCYEGDLSVTAYRQELPLLSFTNPRDSWAFRYAYELVAFVKVGLNQEC